MIGIPLVYFEYSSLLFDRTIETEIMFTMFLIGLIALSLNITAILVLKHTSNGPGESEDAESLPMLAKMSPEVASVKIHFLILLS